MPTYGQRPEDVVQDSRGNTLSSLRLQIYLTEDEAEEGGTAYRTFVTDARGRWTFVTELTEIWVRIPDGTVWALSSPIQVVVGPTPPSDLTAVWINTA